MQRIFKDARPEPDEHINQLNVFASLGEYEPVTFVVFSETGADELNIELSDLINTASAANKISQQNINLKMVTFIEKRTVYNGDPGSYVLLPEILSYYQQINLEPDTFQQYWLTIFVPANTVPGNYLGQIIVKTQNKGTKEITLNLEVLPFVLKESPDKIHGIYYEPKSFGQSEAQLLARMQLELEDLKIHGVKVLHLVDQRTGPTITKDSDGNIQVDYKWLEKSLDLIRDQGFQAPVICYLKQTASNLEKWFPDDPDIRAEIYQKIIEEMKRLAEERNWPRLVFEAVDEPFMGTEEQQQEKIDKLILYGNVIKSVAGTESYTTVIWQPENTPITPELDQLIDIRSYWGKGVDAKLEKSYNFNQLISEAGSDKIWLYYNDIINKPAIADKINSHLESKRIVNGFYLWNSPFEYHLPWVYQNTPGDPLNDLDDTRSDVAYAYPDPNNGYLPTLATLKWETYREGVDDLRYLYTLERVIEENPTSPFVPEGQTLLTNIKNKINQGAPSLEGIKQRFVTDDYQNYRYQIAKIIEKIQL